MGFNLKIFFNDLEYILNSKINWFTKINRLHSCILKAKEYAKISGHLK